MWDSLVAGSGGGGCQRFRSARAIRLRGRGKDVRPESGRCCVWHAGGPGLGAPVLAADRDVGRASQVKVVCRNWSIDRSVRTHARPRQPEDPRAEATWGANRMGGTSGWGEDSGERPSGMIVAVAILVPYGPRGPAAGVGLASRWEEPEV